MRASIIIAALLFIVCTFSACFLADTAKVSALVYDPVHYVSHIKENPKGNEVMLLILSSVLMGVALGLYGYIAVDRETRSSLLLILTMVSSLFYFFFFSSFPVFFVSAGWFVMLLFLSRSLADNLEAYKKPKYFSIASGAVKSSFTIFSAVACVGIFIFLQNNPNITNSIVSGIFQGAVQQTGAFQSQLKQAQLNFTMQTLDMIESVILTTSYSYLSPECRREFAEMYRNIDNTTREAILKQFEKESGTSAQQYISTAIQSTGLYRKLKTIVPAVLALSVLAILETAKGLIIAPVAGTIFWLTRRKGNSPANEKNN